MNKYVLGNNIRGNSNSNSRDVDPGSLDGQSRLIELRGPKVISGDLWTGTIVMMSLCV